ncbi:MAG: hypothetical protein ACFCVD_17685 [Nodosilinea sp.]
MSMNHRVATRRRSYFWLLPVAYLFPIALTVWFVVNFGVNVPHWDQWALVSFFAKIQAGQATFVDFFAQHNEHRMFFPRIIFAILAFVSGWNNKVEMFFSLGLVIMTFGVIYRMALKTRSNVVLFHLVTILSAAFLFSLSQLENWLWGFQIAWFLINLCVVLAIASFALLEDQEFSTRAFLAGLACFVASFSSAHGLVSWLVVLPLIVMEKGSQRQRFLKVAVWMGIFAAVFGLYMLGYVKPEHHPDRLFFLRQPQAAIHYFLVMLGSVFGTVAFPKSLMGLGLLLNFAFFNGYSVIRLSSPATQKMIPWLALGWYPMLFAMATTVGRSGFGTEQATSSRYITVIVLLLIAVLQLWQIFLSEYPQQSLAPTVGVFGTGLLTAVLLAANSHAISLGNGESLAKTRAKLCLELINFLDISDSSPAANWVSFIQPDMPNLTLYTQALTKLNFLTPLEPNDVEFKVDAKAVRGHVDAPPLGEVNLIPIGQENLILSGWAIIAHQPRQSTMLLLAAHDNQPFLTSDLAYIPRPDVAQSLGSSRFLHSGWQLNLPLKTLPAGDHNLKLWVYDRKNSQFLQFSDQISIRISAAD